MNSRIRWPAIAALSAALAFFGCATGGGPDMNGEPGAVTVAVNNNLIPPTSLSVYLVPSSGVRDLLGTVTPSGERSFVYREDVVGGQYRLVAETTAGADIASREFTLFDEGTVVQWDVNLNTVQVEEVGSDG